MLNILRIGSIAACVIALFVVFGIHVGFLNQSADGSVLFLLIFSMMIQAAVMDNAPRRAN